ncbi:MAG: DUF4129 domain-containing protein [Terriglobales bacterium]
MTPRRTYIFAGFLIAALLSAGSFCRADSHEDSSLTVAEYHAALDQLLEATQQLDSSGRETPSALRNLPPSWRVHTEQQDFEISTEGLRRDIHQFQEEKNSTTAIAIRTRIQGLRNDLDGFDASPADVSGSRAHLAAILARPEFRDVTGPTFLDRLAQKMVAAILNLLERLFRSSAIPTISRIFVYTFIALAVLMLGFLAYRQIKSAGAQESAVPTDLPISAKSWALWLADARAAAAQNNWREAIHFGYWAGISFLEHQGTWRPDRARTPREYLRLLSKSSEHRETLAALTRIFELTWYAKREADAGAFAQTMQALERLGCQST